MEYIENPAQHLYELLNEVKNQCNDSSYSQPLFKTAWAKVFNVSENDTVAILQGYVKIRELYNQTLEILHSNDDLNNKMNNAHMKKIKSALSDVSLSSRLDNFTRYYSTDTKTALYYIAREISFKINVKDSLLLSEEQKEDLFNRTEDLLKDFLESDLPNELKFACVDGLTNIKNSLIHYKIYGTEGLKDATSKAVGQFIFIDQEKLVQHRGNSKVTKFFELLQRIKLTIDLPPSAKNLIDSTSPYAADLLDNLKELIR